MLYGKDIYKITKVFRKHIDTRSNSRAMVDNAASLCLAVHQWNILHSCIGDFSTKFLILWARHTIFKSRIEYGTKNNYLAVFYFTFFSLLKNVFWEKYVADNDFGYKTCV